jgi:hypothetical protein
MKETLKWIVICAAGIAGAAVPLLIAFNFWSWVMDQVPRSNEWAGLVKVGLTFLMLVPFGGITMFCTFGAMALAGSLAFIAVKPE